MKDIPSHAQLRMRAPRRLPFIFRAIWRNTFAQLDAGLLGPRHLPSVLLEQHSASAQVARQRKQICMYVCMYACMYVYTLRVLLSFQQPTFLKSTSNTYIYIYMFIRVCVYIYIYIYIYIYVSAAWSTFHLKHVSSFVSSELLKSRLFKLLLDHPMVLA